MEEIAVSEFQATCLVVLNRVRRTGKPIRVTKFGKPIADVVPISKPSLKKESWIGSMEGTLKIRGDIVSPASK